MSHRSIAAIATLLFVVGCSSSSTGPDETNHTDTGLRIVNGFVAPVDLLFDGSVVASAIPQGTATLVDAQVGKHTYTVRPTGGGAASNVEVKVFAGRHVAVAATRSSGGALMATFLEDTNAIVPANATKVRVLHLAPLAGEVQVWRTQPDYGTPIRWQFPFVYSAEVSALGNPYYQSTVGEWDIRVWTDVSVHPAGDPALWPTPLQRVHFTLGSGEKRTVLILDKPGGGVTLEVIE